MLDTCLHTVKLLWMTVAMGPGTLDLLSFRGKTAVAEPVSVTCLFLDISEAVKSQLTIQLTIQLT